MWQNTTCNDKNWKSKLQSIRQCKISSFWYIKMESDANKTQNAQKRSVSVAASIDLTSNITDTLKSLSEEK